MPAPRLTEKVKRGLFKIVARSATVMEAEYREGQMEKEEREQVLAASKYVLHHFRKFADNPQQEINHE